MPSIAHIQSQLKEFDKAARKASETKDAETALKNAWERIFATDLEPASAKSFARYYREMRSRSKTMRGGASFAPLNYQMTPGLHVQTYGSFPVEAGMDPASIRNLDVYFQDSLTKGCGIEDSGRHVPATMGSNKVGGSNRSRRSGHRKGRKTMRKGSVGRKSSRNSRRKTLRKSRRQQRGIHRGGNLLTSLTTHPYLSSSPPNTIQNASVSWAGAQQPPSGNPVVPAWGYATNGSDRLINPGLITQIGSDMTKLASPSPWQTTQ